MNRHTADEIARLGTIVGIWAHPDDEAFSMAGVMSYARRNGQRVVVLTATAGDAGNTADEEKWPQAKLGSIRQNELAASLAVSGVSEWEVLDYKDGTLIDQDERQAARVLADHIKKIQPDTVITFFKDGITGHDDHKTVHAWTKAALRELKQDIKLLCVVECHETYEEHGRECHEHFNIYFNTVRPHTVKRENADLCVVLDSQAKKNKEQALRAHASQTAHMFEHKNGADKLLKSTCDCECYVDCPY